MKHVVLSKAFLPKQENVFTALACGTVSPVLAQQVQPLIGAGGVQRDFRRFWMAVALELEGRRPEAMQYWQALPQSDLYFIHLASWAEALNEEDCALFALKRAVDIHPSAEAYFRLGEVYVGIGRLQDGRQAFERSLEVASGHAETAWRADGWAKFSRRAAYSALARISLRVGDLDGAEAEFRQAISSDSEDLEIRIELAKVLAQQEAPIEEIEMLLATTVRLNPASPWPYLTLCDIYRQYNIYARAMAACREAPVGNSLQEMWQHIYLARIAYDQGNYADARHVLMGARREGERNVQWLLWMGQAEHRLGDREAARRWLQRALSLEPNNPWVALALGRVTQELGDTETARSLFIAVRQSGIWSAAMQAEELLDSLEQE